MDSLLKSDIFFFITAVAVVVLSITIMIAMYYAIRILRDIGELSEYAKDEGKNIINDIASTREDIKKGKNKIKSIISRAASSSKSTKRSQQKKQHGNTKEEQ